MEMRDWRMPRISWSSPTDSSPRLSRKIIRARVGSDSKRMDSQGLGMDRLWTARASMSKEEAPNIGASRGHTWRLLLLIHPAADRENFPGLALAVDIGREGFAELVVNELTSQR